MGAWFAAVQGGRRLLLSGQSWRVTYIDWRVVPRWPDPAHPQQFHLDVRVDDVAEAEPAALALGATRLPGEGDNWRVYADPVGKPFCLVWDL